MHWIALQAPPEGPILDGAAVSDPRTALAWWALQFSPLLARVNAALVLEVSASERLFGGRAALLEQLLHSGPVQPQRHAQGATSLVALARLWCSTDDPLAPALAVDLLPVSALQAAQPHLPTLERLGCRTWGDLRALPRGGLVRRFGAALLDALDCAYGQRSEVYPWLTLPEVFDEKLELAAAVESAPALLFGARRLLAQLLVWLRARQRGALVLEFGWQLDARRSSNLHRDAHHGGDGWGRLVLHTAQATQDIAHLQRLLGEQLARVTLPAPVLYVRLRSLQTQPLGGETHSLLPGDLRSGDPLHQMLERVGSRLGADKVLCVQTLADHVPERMQRWVPWSAVAPARTAARSADNLHPDSALYPSWLLEVPLKLPVHRHSPYYLGDLHLLAGPQRLEGGWLDGTPVLRDYFVARSPQAGLVWIYRERLQTQAQWYLHGLFA